MRKERHWIGEVDDEILAQEQQYAQGTTSEDGLAEDEGRVHRCRFEVVDRLTVGYSGGMREVRDSLLRQNKLLVDVPYDGSCGIWSVMPAFGAALGRPTSKTEVRQIVVAQLGAPEFRGELEADLSATNDLRRREGRRMHTIDDLLQELAEPDRFVPPTLLMRATERFTRGRVRMWANDADKNVIPFLWSDGDDDIPFCCEFVHVPSRGERSHLRMVNEAELTGGHIARVLSLPSSRATIDAPTRKRPYDDVQSLERVLDRLNAEARTMKRLRDKMAQ